MAIAYYGTGGGAIRNNGSSIAISTPASVPAGAVMVCTIGGFLSSQGNASGTGWTQVAKAGAGNGGAWLLTKVADGGDGTQTITIPAGSYVSGAILVFTGVDTTTPVLAYGVNYNNGTGQSAWPTASVNNTDSAAAAVAQVAAYGGSGGSPWTEPGGYTEVVDLYSSSINHDASYLLNAPTGSQSVTVNYSSTASYGGTAFYFLKPASGPITPSGSIAAVAPGAQSSISGSALVGGSVSAYAPSVQSFISGSATATGSVDAQSIAPNASVSGTATASGSVASTSPTPLVSADGAVGASGTLGVQTLVPSVELAGYNDLSVHGSLAAICPVPVVSLWQFTSSTRRRIYIEAESRVVVITKNDRTSEIPAEGNG